MKLLPVLSTANVHWQEAKDGEVPPGAVIGGINPMRGERMFIGRTRLKENRNELTPGIVVPSEK